MPQSGWSETPYQRPMSQDIYVKQFLWSAEVTSTLTGESFPVHYYVSCTVSPEDMAHPEARAAREEIALLTIRLRVDGAAQGWAYLPAWDRTGMVGHAVIELIRDWWPDQFPEDWDLRLREVMGEANMEYEQHWAAAARLGAELGDGFGWKIPIHPLPASIVEWNRMEEPSP